MCIKRPALAALIVAASAPPPPGARGRPASTSRTAACGPWGAGGRSSRAPTISGPSGTTRPASPTPARASSSTCRGSTSTVDYTRELQVVDAGGAYQRFTSPTVTGGTPILPLPTIAASYDFGSRKEWTLAGGVLAPYIALTAYPADRRRAAVARALLDGLLQRLDRRHARRVDRLQAHRGASLRPRDAGLRRQVPVDHHLQREPAGPPPRRPRGARVRRRPRSSTSAPSSRPRPTAGSPTCRTSTSASA